MTNVGHVEADDIDVYAGRGRNGRHLLSTATGEYGWLGNPYPLSEMPREESIEQYRQSFKERLRDDREFLEAVASLSGKTLGCWCRTRSDDGPECHADVIAEWADTLDARRRTCDVCNEPFFDGIDGSFLLCDNCWEKSK